MQIEKWYDSNFVAGWVSKTLGFDDALRAAVLEVLKKYEEDVVRPLEYEMGVLKTSVRLWTQEKEALEAEITHQKTNWREMHRDCLKAEAECVRLQNRIKAALNVLEKLRTWPTHCTAEERQIGFETAMRLALAERGQSA